MKKKSVFLCFVLTVSLVACGKDSGSRYALSAAQQKEVLQNMEYGAQSIDDFMKNYLTLGNYTGFSYEITQTMWDESIADDTKSFNIVKRAAKDTDSVSFNIIGYVDEKKVKDLSFKEQEVVLGEAIDGPYANIPELLRGKSAGDVIKNVKLEAKQISQSGNDYAGQKVTFDIKVVNVSEVEMEKITDQWVKDTFYEEYGWKTIEDYYQGKKEELMSDAKDTLWKQVIENSTVKKYPQEAYDRIVEEVDADNNYTADEWNMSLQEYYDSFAITQEALDETYQSELASEMIAWAIAIKEKVTNISSTEMEANWEGMYKDLGYDSVEAMKADRDEKEIIRAIILDHASTYVFEHSTITENYEIK